MPKELLANPTYEIALDGTHASPTGRLLRRAQLNQYIGTTRLPDTNTFGALIECKTANGMSNQTVNGFVFGGRARHRTYHGSMTLGTDFDYVNLVPAGMTTGIFDTMQLVHVTLDLNEAEKNINIGHVSVNESKGTDSILLSQSNDLIKDSFFSTISNLQSLGLIDTALDKIYNFFENRLIAGHTNLCNNILSDSKVKDLNYDLQLGLLVVTKPWKNRLTARAALYDELHKSMLATNKKERVEKILGGLI